MTIIFTYLVTILATIVLCKQPLEVFVLLPIVGDEPRRGEACRVAIDIVFSEVNNRSDLLQNYQLRGVYMDEGRGSYLGPVQLAKFKERQGNLSPLMIGPFFSAGCKAVAAHVHFYDMAMVTVGCSPPQPATDRRIFPNLYRSKITATFNAFAKLQFIRDIGNRPP